MDVGPIRWARQIRKFGLIVQIKSHYFKQWTRGMRHLKKTILKIEVRYTELTFM